MGFHGLHCGAGRFEWSEDPPRLHRRVRTFEDALIFVLDVERCLNRLSLLDRQIISRVVLQEYTQTEAAVLLGTSSRTIGHKLPKAIDRLTEDLVASNLLTLPD